MTIKEAAISSIQNLPENATWEDVVERINFIAGVKKGLSELDKGKGIKHDQIMEEFKEWLSN